MLKTLDLENFTVFRSARLEFSPQLNVFVGENGAGKTHALKAAYCGISVLADGKSGWNDGWSRNRLQIAMAEKLLGVFRPDALGRLVWRAQGRLKSAVKYSFGDAALNMDLTFSRLAKEVTIQRLPSKQLARRPVFLPTRELLTIAPGFVSLYETAHLPFEETWRDTCLLLGAPLVKGPRESTVKTLLSPLESAMGGRVDTDKAGRFYLVSTKGGRLEMQLVAEGLRKLATIARLIATGALLDKGYLFWDEPEANLNPRTLKSVARVIFELAGRNIQVFVATHSNFLLRELHLLQRQSSTQTRVRYFGLHPGPEGEALVSSSDSVDGIGSIAALDEDLEQSDRYVNAEMGLDPELVESNA